MEEAKAFCRKCLIPDYIEDKEAFLKNYLGRIPPEERTEEAVYDHRMEQCESCGRYLNGMCRLCGCFVAIRAAGRRQSCPEEPPRWKEL